MEGSYDFTRFILDNEALVIIATCEYAVDRIAIRGVKPKVTKSLLRRSRHVCGHLAATTSSNNRRHSALSAITNGRTCAMF